MSFDRELAHFTEKQLEATRAADNYRYVLYGGARGPGKSYWLRWYLLRFLLIKGQEHPGLRVMLACEDYPSLHDRQISKVMAEFPRWLGSYYQPHHEFRLRKEYGGGVLCLRNLDDPSKYMSAEFAAIGIDELTRNEKHIFDVLRGSLRWPRMPDTRFVAATNPGGAGHLWVKQLWIDRDFPPEMAKFADQFVFIRALPTDNPYLSESYWHELNSLPRDMARAWVEGDWNVFAGQVFTEWNYDRHTCEPFPIPEKWPKWRAVDWGFAKPFCCLWFAQDPETDIIYVYREVYQAGLTDRQQAQVIRELSRGETYLWTLADPSMWTVRNREGLTFSSADEYMACGIPIEQADNDRLIGLRRVREQLSLRPDGEPGLKVFRTCANFIRTIPALCYSERDVEDVSHRAEDHAYDALRYGLMRGVQHSYQAVIQRPNPYDFIG